MKVERHLWSADGGGNEIVCDSALQCIWQYKITASLAGHGARRRSGSLRRTAIRSSTAAATAWQAGREGVARLCQQQMGQSSGASK